LMLQKPPLSPVLLKVSYDQGGRDLQWAGKTHIVE
jgi:hypothetical protein